MSAADEIHRHGYAGASLDRILAHSGVTKGALYHHFGSKAELAYAVIEEVLRPMVTERWLAPLAAAEDPITGLVQVLSSFAEMSDEEIQRGCPVNNLSQELANAEDELFRLRLGGVLGAWEDGIAGALEQGQTRGTVRPDIEVDAVASFVVAGFEGIASLAKTTRDRERAARVVRVLVQYLETLRPGPATRGAEGAR